MFVDPGDEYYLGGSFATSPQACLCMPSSYMPDGGLIDAGSNFFSVKESRSVTGHDSNLCGANPACLHQVAQQCALPCLPLTPNSNTFGSPPTHCLENVSTIGISNGDSPKSACCPCAERLSTANATSKEGAKASENKKKKKQAQNRAAQRAFRQRKEQRVKYLQEREVELETDTKNLLEDNQRRKQMIRDLCIENQALRAISAGTINRDAYNSHGHLLSRKETCSKISERDVSKAHPIKGSAESSRHEKALYMCSAHTSGCEKQPYDVLDWKRCSLLLSEDDINEKLKAYHGDDDHLS